VEALLNLSDRKLRETHLDGKLANASLLDEKYRRLAEAMAMLFDVRS